MLSFIDVDLHLASMHPFRGFCFRRKYCGIEKIKIQFSLAVFLISCTFVSSYSLFYFLCKDFRKQCKRLEKWFFAVYSFLTLFGPLIGETRQRPSRNRHDWSNSDQWPGNGGPGGPPRGKNYV